jgi:hypothetical protein
MASNYYDYYLPEHEEKLKENYHNVRQHYDDLARKLRKYDKDIARLQEQLSNGDAVLLHGGYAGQAEEPTSQQNVMNAAVTGKNVVMGLKAANDARKLGLTGLKSNARARLAEANLESLPPAAQAFLMGVDTAQQVVGYAEKAIEILENPMVLKVIGPKVAGPMMKMFGSVAKIAGPLGFAALAATTVMDLVDVFKGEKSPSEMLMNLIPGANEVCAAFGFKPRLIIDDAMDVFLGKRDPKELLRYLNPIYGIERLFGKKNEEEQQAERDAAEDARDQQLLATIMERWQKAGDEITNTMGFIYKEPFDWIKNHNKDDPESRKVLDPAMRTLIDWLTDRYDLFETFNPKWIKTRLNPVPTTPPWEKPFTSLQLIYAPGEGDPAKVVNRITFNGAKDDGQGYISSFALMLMMGNKFQITHPDVNSPGQNVTYDLQGLGFDSTFSDKYTFTEKKEIIVPYDEMLNKPYLPKPNEQLQLASAETVTDSYGDQKTTDWLKTDPTSSVSLEANPDDTRNTAAKKIYTATISKTLDLTVLGPSDLAKGGSVTDGDHWIARVLGPVQTAAISDIVARDWTEGRDLAGTPDIFIQSNRLLVKAIQRTADGGNEAERVSLEDLQTEEEAAAEAERKAQEEEYLKDLDEKKFLQEKKRFDDLEAQGLMTDNFKFETQKGKDWFEKHKQEEFQRTLQEAKDEVAKGMQKTFDEAATASAKLAVEQAAAVKANADEQKAREDYYNSEEYQKQLAEERAKVEADVQNWRQENPEEYKQQQENDASDTANAATVADFQEKLASANEAVQVLQSDGNWSMSAEPYVANGASIFSMPPSRPFDSTNPIYGKALEVIKLREDHDNGLPPPTPTQMGLFGGKRTTRKRIRYWATVADGVDYPARHFLNEIDHYVNDPAGWVAKGYDFVLSEKNPDALFTLVPDRPDMQGLSWSHPTKNLIEINATNYLHGVPKTHLSLHEYRQYLISHELGHMLGHEHSNPHPHGQPVPVMHQQSRLGIQGFTPNNKVVPTVKRPREELEGGFDSVWF